MHITIYSKDNCPNCEKAKALAIHAGYNLHIKKLDEDISREAFFKRFNNAKTLPQIEINGRHIGGFIQLEQHVFSHSTAPMCFDEDF